ncbi:quinol:cytochrome C oxidoreductase [bacterium CG_4_9_14_3_um_filter_65_15]|nr:MAG: quinol:cytochrome C oxidoreductase [bacterium CG_4_9_14_3_um_filter_65_15]
MNDKSVRIEDTNTSLTGLGRRGFMISAVVGVIAMAATVALGAAAGDGMRRLGYTYLISYAYVLSVSLGALTFLPIMSVTKASWHIVIRRLAEVMAAVMPLLAILAIPVILFAGKIYGWADPQIAASAAMAHKAAWFSQGAFILRWVIYFCIWSGYGIFFWRQSLAQDVSGDDNITRRVENLSGFSIMIGAITIAMASFDLLMSVDPLWFSTIFGVYYWAGGFVSFFAVLTLLTFGLQNTGRMTRIVSPEHIHDYGKGMFAFTFFWAYIAFSQYMLYWYANIPEETNWFLERSREGWGKLGIFLIFAAFVLPFAGLISRYAKRHRKMLAFWAVWIIAAQWLNLYWVVMPSFSEKFVFGVMDVTCFIGIAGLWLAAITRLAMGHSLVPLKDPRLEASLRFENA